MTHFIDSFYYVSFLRIFPNYTRYLILNIKQHRFLGYFIFKPIIATAILEFLATDLGQERAKK